MQSLRFPPVLAACLGLLACAPEPPPAVDPALAARAWETHDAVLTLDSHVDIPFDFATETADPLDGNMQVNLHKMREGGLDAAFFAVYVGQTERTPDNYARARSDAGIKFDAIHRMTETYPEHIGLARSADEAEQLWMSGRLVAAIGIENGYVIGTDVDLLDHYHALGARYMTLVHNGHNDIGDSATPRPALGDAVEEHGGLSELGRHVVERMNDLGIMVDISHASKRTALDAIRASRAPVIASHSAVRALADHPRNLDDETLLALRDNGGVVQIVAYEAFLKVHPPERDAALNDLQARTGVDSPARMAQVSQEQRLEFGQGMVDINQRWPPPSVRDLVDHIDYAVELIGIDHVGISSDFGGGGGIVGWTDAIETPNVTFELLRRGYDEEQIAKLWSGNLLRVWREAERHARP